MALGINSRGSQVVRLQKELKAAGMAVGRADGVFGKGTLKAVKQYQTRYRLGADGVVGAKTWNKLLTDGMNPPGVRRTAPAAAAAAAPRGSQVTGYVGGVPRRIRVSSVGGGKVMRADAAAKFNAMKAAARRAGISLNVNSAFRTMAQQRSLYAAYRSGRGNLAARPGYSNHQGGLSADVATGSYGSRTYKWMARNARAYGFVNDVRGEPWHWTFRG